MKKNMGAADIGIRLLLGAIISGLYFTHTISRTSGVIAVVIAGILILTGLTGVCPLYSLFRLTTRKKKTI